MTAAMDWAFTELDLRRAEDARFPATAMHMERKRRRKERGYTKKTADDLVARAAEMDGVA